MAAHEVLYQNQMQFNLGVPLAASNIASHHHKPGPIMVERIGGRCAIPGKPQAYQPKNANVSASSSFNYTMLSEDTMAKVSQMAKRDLKNKRLQLQRERDKSPVGESIASVQRRQSQKMCTRQRNPLANKPRTPLRARESEKNRRIGSVQTPPPPRKPKLASSNSQLADDSAFDIGGGEDSRQTDHFFPIKPVAKSNLPTGGAKDEMWKLQQELESYLQSLCHIEQQVLKNGSADFLQNKVKRKGKNNFLAEEEDLDRLRARAGEHNTRSARNLYNLWQKVKQLQRDISQSDLSKPTKKSQIAAQLNATYRGAVRALQVFVNQLPYQDLQMGLPSTYNELALLLRQLTTLMTLTQQGTTLEVDGGPDNNVLTLLDQVDDFNSKWCSMVLQSSKAGRPFNRRAISANQNIPPKAWISDTKVDTDPLSKNVTEFTTKRPAILQKKNLAMNRPMPKYQPRQQQQMPGSGGKIGKENRISVVSEGPKSGPSKASLTAQKTFGFVSLESKPSQSSKSVMREIDSTKGYMLPLELMAKRERAQRAVELSNKNFAESTHSSRSKASNLQRPHSVPSPGRKKEVNFDLREDKRSHQPWIPAGYAPCKQIRARSSSAERSPFYVKTFDGQEIWEDMPDRHARSVMMHDKQRETTYGHRSLPTERQLRSCDVSDSFVDLIEKRILYRISSGKAVMRGMGQTRKDQMLYSSNEALDITDLTVDKSYDDTMNTSAEAVSMVDAPTLENIQLKLANMERTRREIRQRWSTLKFMDAYTKSRHITNECPADPPAIDSSRLTTSKAERKSDNLNDEFDEPINKGWSEEPVLFTKPMYASKPRVAVTKNTSHSSTAIFPPKVRPQVKLNPSTLDRILENRDQFEDHFRKNSHHPTGKFDPWTLMEEISEEILKECLQEVSEEVEKVSEEIANQMYKSEFMVTGRPSDADLLTFDLEAGTEGYGDLGLKESGRNASMLSDQDIYGRLEDFRGDNGMSFGDYGVGREFGMDEETPRSYASSRSAFKPLSHGVPSEPLLDNVSQLVQEKVEGLVEYSCDDDDDDMGDRAGKSEDEEYDDKGDEEYDEKGDEEYDEEEDDDYLDDEFEDVSDVEL